MSGGEMRAKCVLFKGSWVIVVGSILKYYHVSTRKEFMWAGFNSKFPCFLVQFILSLPYKSLSFKCGKLYFGWLFIDLPKFMMKYWM